MNKPTNRVKAANVKPDYDAINERALLHMDDVLHHLDLDGGKYVGKEYKALNPHRNDGEPGSFSINTETGLWKDFATDYGGGDVVSYWKFVKGFKYQPEAAFDLEAFLDSLEGPTPTSPTPGPAKKPSAPHLREVSKEGKAGGQKWTAILPVPETAPQPPEGHHELGKPTHSWLYKDAQGQLLGRIDRYEGKAGKEFRPMTYCRNAETEKEQWRVQGFPEPRPLYGLELLAAKPEAEIVICEGEKAADAARLLLPACIAVTTMNGAKSPAKTDFKPLIGRSVTIWPDNDDVGEGYAIHLVKLLRAVEPEMPVRIIKPLMQMPGVDGDGKPTLQPRPDLPEKWDAADAVADGWTAERMALVWSDPKMFAVVPVNKPEVAIASFGEYVLSERGVVRHYFDKSGEPRHDWICSYLKVLAHTRDVNGKNWGLLVELTDKDGNRHQWAFPSEMMTTQGCPFVQTLNNFGLRSGIGSGGKERVAAYLNEVMTDARALCVPQQGWYDQVFATAEGTIGPTTIPVVVQTGQPDSLKVFRTKGTHADWVEHVARYCEGNTRLIFSVCTALTSPVLHWMNEENGGFHLRGNSSMGKTVALNVAVSVWGGPDYLQRWRATANGLEATATLFNDTFLALDEISQVDAKEAGETAYMLANGQGKLRAGNSGQARAVARWRLIFLSTGEISLSDHVQSSGKRVMAGQEIRFVNIPADAGKGFKLFDTIHEAESGSRFAEMLRGNAATNFGTAGPMWVTLLADPEFRELALQKTKAVKDAFVRDFVPVSSDGQVFRGAGRFGLVAGVGEACIEAGILPWPVGSVIHAARECFLSWVEDRGGTESFEAETAVNQVRLYIENHGESRFTLWDQVNGGDGFDAGSRTINRAGFKRVMDDGSIRYYVLPEAFRREICQGLNAKEVAKVLLQRQYLLPDKDGKATTTHSLPGVKGSSKVYLLTSAILGENQPPATATLITQVANG